MKKIALYPGTFDPITLGHIDVIKVAAKIFDEVVVALLINPKKKPMFSEEERLAMINQAINDDNLANVRATSFRGLTIELACQEKAIAIIRGLRLTTEYEVELNISFNNRILNSNLYTIFIAPLQKHIHISSSAVRELISFGRTDLPEYVPEAVIRQIKQ